jgi:hypothetical protein
MVDTMAPDPASPVTLLDQTLHYFGGYYHVKVLAYRDIDLEERFFDTEAEYLHAVEKLGTQVRFERILEKMAVPESEVPAVRSQLIQAFQETSAAYLSSPDFAPRFVRNEYLKQAKKSLRTHAGRA